MKKSLVIASVLAMFAGASFAADAPAAASSEPTKVAAPAKHKVAHKKAHKATHKAAHKAHAAASKASN